MRLQTETNKPIELKVILAGEILPGGRLNEHDSRLGDLSRSFGWNLAASRAHSSSFCHLVCFIVFGGPAGVFAFVYRLAGGATIEDAHVVVAGDLVESLPSLGCLAAPTTPTTPTTTTTTTYSNFATRLNDNDDQTTTTTTEIS